MTQKHPFIPTDENKRFLFCPICGNESFSKDARFCRMCGQDLFNKCINQENNYREECGLQNLGDARYCEYCGCETVLTRTGLLMSWEEIVQIHGEIAAGLEPEYEAKVNNEKTYSLDGINLDDLPF